MPVIRAKWPTRNGRPTKSGVIDGENGTTNGCTFPRAPFFPLSVTLCKMFGFNETLIHSSKICSRRAFDMNGKPFTEIKCNNHVKFHQNPLHTAIMAHDQLAFMRLDTYSEIEYVSCFSFNSVATCAILADSWGLFYPFIQPMKQFSNTTDKSKKQVKWHHKLLQVENFPQQRAKTPSIFMYSPAHKKHKHLYDKSSSIPLISLLILLHNHTF